MRWIRNRRRAIEDWLGPFLFGLIDGLVAPLFIAGSLWISMTSYGPVADPSAEVFRDLAQIGAAVFIAFAISTAAAATIAGSDLKLHLSWLGTTCGLGLTGFLGTLASVGLAAYRDAGHSGWLDLLGLFWILAGILLLGCLVAALPYATFRWSQRSSSGS